MLRLILQTDNSTMIRSMKKLLFCAALALSSLPLAHAQDSTNLNVFTFGPPLTPVWDISGIYQITNHMQGVKLSPVDVIFRDLGIGVDPKGKVIGGGTMLVYIGNGAVGGDYKVSGKVSGGGDKTKVNFSVKFKGIGTVAGVNTTCNISIKYNLAVVPAALAMAGKTSGNANFTHLGGGKFKSDIAVPLPPDANGGWYATLDILPFGNQLSGTAVIIVSNTVNTTLATKVKGNVPKSGPAKVKLTGTGNSKGTQLNMEFALISGATNLATKVNGKILGQKVKN
jgi:hypothetical protein